MTRGHVDDRNSFLLQERYCKSLCFRGHFIYLPCRDNLIHTTEGAEKWFKKIQRNETTIRLDNHCKVAGITSAFLHASLPAAPPHVSQPPINPLWRLSPSHRYHQRLPCRIQFSGLVSLVAPRGWLVLRDWSNIPILKISPLWICWVSWDQPRQEGRPSQSREVCVNSSQI